MQPEQPYQSPQPAYPPQQVPQPTGNDKFDFIVNPSKPPKKPFLIGGGGMGRRIVLVAGAIFVVLIIFVIAKSLFGSGSGLDKAAMLSVDQDQSELIHLSITGTTYSTSQDNKNFSVNAQLSITSQQGALTTYLQKQGYKPKPKLLMVKQSPAIDAQLTSSQNSSTFDSVYAGIMQQQLTTYQKDLTTAYQKAGPKGKTLLNSDYNAAQLLSKQLTSVDN